MWISQKLKPIFTVHDCSCGNSIIYILLILLISGVNILPVYSQDSKPTLDEFRGFFSQETYGNDKTKRDSPISASFVFQEGEDGSKYAVYIPFYVSLPILREYKIEGILSQKFLPQNAKVADYLRIIQSAFPDLTPYDTEQAAKSVKNWMKKNSNMPLLLVNSLQRVNPPVEVDKEKLIIIERPPPPRRTVFRSTKGFPEKIFLEIVVSENGYIEKIEFAKGSHSIDEIKILKENSYLLDYAVDAVRQSKFSPVLIDGTAVAVRTILEVEMQYFRPDIP